MRRSTFLRTALCTSVVLVAVFPWVLSGLLSSFGDMHNVPVLWLPESSKPRRDFMAYLEQFKTDDTIVVSWDGCTLDDERLLQFAEAVSDPGRQLEIEEQTNLSGQVLDGYTIVRDLADSLRLSRREAKERLRGLLVGHDGETSCALVQYRWRANERRQSTIDFLIDEAEAVGVPRDTIHLAGSNIEGLAIDAESTKSFHTYAFPSGVVAVLMCWLCLRSWRLTLAVICVSGFCEALVLAIVSWCGVQMNAILIVMAPLVFVLAVSAGVHLSNYYHEECYSGVESATQRALRAGWWPCGFCAVTTALGMGSLMVSQIIPVRQFGAITAFAVLFTVTLLFLVLPGAMEWHSQSIQQRAGSLANGPHPERWNGVTKFLSRIWLPVAVLGIGLMLGGLYGVTKVETSVEVLSLLKKQHPLVQDYQWFEEHLGALVPLEVIVQIPKDSGLDTLQQVETVRKVEATLKSSPTLGGVVSATTFLPPIPEPGGLSQKFRRTVIAKRVETLKPMLNDLAWLHQSEKGQSWRISARVPAFGGVDYDQMLSDLRGSVADTLSNLPNARVSATFTGLTPVVSQSQQMLLDDLFHSFAMALILVCGVLIIVFRSVPAGLFAMIPNVFPSIILFGFMGLLDFKVDIGTVMTASVALGIAVDDTIHLLTWFRFGMQQYGSRIPAVRFALNRTALAMVQTTAICGLGLAPFVMAEFLPTARFSWMMLTLLLAALVGDLLLLPALLLSPLGRFAAPRSSESTVTQTEQ